MLQCPEGFGFTIQVIWLVGRWEFYLILLAISKLQLYDKK